MNRVNSIIKLRADSIDNWLSNLASTLHDGELVVIKYTDGTIGLKLGNGSAYGNTELIKFNQIATNTLTDGTNTFTFPSTGGELVTSSTVNDAVSKINAMKQLTLPDDSVDSITGYVKSIYQILHS